MSSLRNADAALTNAQSLTSEDSSETATDVLLSQISLLFKSKIIKPEKIKTYKSQNENEHQR